MPQSSMTSTPLFPPRPRGRPIRLLAWGLLVLASVVDGAASAGSSLTCSTGPAAVVAHRGNPGPPSRSEIISAARAAEASGGSFEQLDGWLRLIEVADRVALGEPRASAALAGWFVQYPDHPAKGYALRLQGGAAPIGTVLALLPNSGQFAPAGRAIAEGLWSKLGPNLSVLDVGSGTLPIGAIAERLLAERPAMVVGPLLKEQVIEWARQQPPVPTLALNTLPAGVNGPTRFYQFALAPEDEGRALAERVVVEVGKSCGRVRVESGDNWRRFAAAFEEQLRRLGGCAVEAEAAREEVFVLLASSSLAQVRHSMADPPVYTTARGATADGLRLIGPPLAVGLRPAQLTDEVLLQAFGRDAGRLAITLAGSTRAPVSVQGETGELTVDETRQVRRALVMMRLERGRLAAECP